MTRRVDVNDFLGVRERKQAHVILILLISEYRRRRLGTRAFINMSLFPMLPRQRRAMQPILNAPRTNNATQSPSKTISDSILLIDNHAFTLTQVIMYLLRLLTS